MSAKVLVDTNIWVKFFRFGNPLFAALLEGNEVLCHPLVLGEISMGNLADRRAVLSDLFLLEHVPEATFAEVCHLVESRQLWGRGLQWNDVSILAAAVIADVKVWTLDLRMAEVARQLGVCWEG
jgi:predicted nucleic acid-binding protein